MWYAEATLVTGTAVTGTAHTEHARCAAVSPASSWRSTPREPLVRRVVPGSSGVEGAVLAEAEIVAPGVDHVEGALAPGAVEHFAGRFAVHLVGRQHAET